MPGIPRFNEYELTGRARVRSGWFGRQILQVEFRVLSISGCPPMPGTDPKVWQKRMRDEANVSLRWYDATSADIQALPGFTLGNPVRSGNEMRIDLNVDAAPALEALKQVQAAAERVEAAVQKARKSVDGIRPLPVRQMSERRPPRDLPPTPPPMKDERFRTPAKKRSARK